MFENFSFAAKSRIPYNWERSASPTDTTHLWGPIMPPTSHPVRDEVLDGVVHRLEQQHLTSDGVVKWSQHSTPALEIDDDDDDDDDVVYDDEDMDMSYPTHKTSIPSAPSHNSDVSSPTPVVCRRLQRQLNVQMQTSSSHLRDISTLVESMIASSSQCQVYPSLTRYDSPTGPSYARRSEAVDVDTECAGVIESERLSPELDVDEDVDEGFHEEIVEEISLRRAGTPSRIRKQYGGLTFSRSTDVVLENGKVKVKCKPRMRKRKTTVVRE